MNQFGPPEAKLFQDERELNVVRNIEQTETGGTFFRVLDRMLKQERDRLEANPQNDPVNVINQVGYRLGFIAALRAVRELPGKATEIIQGG